MERSNASYSFRNGSYALYILLCRGGGRAAVEAAAGSSVGSVGSVGSVLRRQPWSLSVRAVLR